MNSATAEGGIEVVDGATIYDLPIIPSSGGNDETGKQSANGDYHERRVGFQVKGLRQELVDLKRGLMNRRVHVLFTDLNCRTYVYLNTRLRQSSATNRRGSRYANDFEFRGASTTPAEFVRGVLLPPTVQDDDDDLILNDPGETSVPPPTSGGDVGGEAGGGADDELAPPSDTAGGGTTPGPTAQEGIRFLQPDTGDFYSIKIGPCGQIISEKIE